MNTQDFQAAALAWVGTLAIVVPAVAAGVAKVLPSIEALAAQIEDMKRRLDRQTERQNQQERTVAQVALAAQPPTASAGHSSSAEPVASSSASPVGGEAAEAASATAAPGATH
jgi:hypothetical protein